MLSRTIGACAGSTGSTRMGALAAPLAIIVTGPAKLPGSTLTRVPAGSPDQGTSASSA